MCSLPAQVLTTKSHRKRAFKLVKEGSFRSEVGPGFGLGNRTIWCFLLGGYGCLLEKEGSSSSPLLDYGFGSVEPTSSVEGLSSISALGPFPGFPKAGKS